MWRHVKDVLLLKPAMTSRNMVTVLLVALMFGVYVASGGKVTTVPQVRPGEGFGTVDRDPAEQALSQQQSPAPSAPAEAVPTKRKESREAVRKRLAENLKKDPRRLRNSNKTTSRVRASGLPAKAEVVEEVSPVDSEGDDFSALEKRLKKGRR